MIRSRRSAGRAGIDEHGADVVEPALVGDRGGDELRAVIEPHERGGAPAGRKQLEGRDDLAGVDRSFDDDRRAFAGVLVDDVEQLQGATVGGCVELEVERPQRVGATGYIAPLAVPIPRCGLLRLR
jgi:hypothetical protein